MLRTGLGRFLPTALRRQINHLRLSVRLRNSLNLDTLRPPKTFNGEFVAVAGVFNTTTGLARAAELVALSLEERGYRVVRVDIGRALGQKTTSDRSDFITPTDCATLPVTDLVLVINPDAYVLSVFDKAWLVGRCVIGHWIWELERLPPLWRYAVVSYDEIWVPTSLIQDVVLASLPDLNKPLAVMPYAVYADPVPTITPTERSKIRLRLGISDNTFVMGYSFAVDSNYYRKNPEDAVRAFKQAFPTSSNEDVRLYLRCNDFTNRPLERTMLEATIANDMRIQILGPKSHIGIRDFYAALDVYFSTSRAEGYGLNLVEAAQAGLPVITNGWRISSDILALPQVRPTDYEIISVNDPQGHYAMIAGAVWSAPNLDSIATMLVEQYYSFRATL